MKTPRNTKTLSLTGLSLAFAVITSGCGSEDGSLTVLLESEDVIVDGLEAGDGTENIRDGWNVTFDKYVVVVGDIDLHFSSDESLEAEAGDIFAVDLTQVPSSGLELWGFDELKSGRWEFNYWTSGGAHDARRDDSVSRDDFDEMVDNDWTYLIEGELSNEEGQSCPPASLVDPGEKESNGKESGGNPCYDAQSVKFVLGATAETSYGPCEIDDVPGVSVPSGGTQTVAITIHGDHIFFNGFPEGDEGGVRREAQWLADCDLNLDGTVTQEELEAITPAQLPAMEDYQLGGAPIEPSDMYEYVRAQLKTQGHYQGEGECPVDGVAHEHGDHEDEDDHDD
jgi:hypothetical protein